MNIDSFERMLRSSFCSDLRPRRRNMECCDLHSMNVIVSLYVNDL